MKNLKTRVCQIVKDKKGNSEMVAVIVLMIIVLVIGALVFLPGLKGYLTDTVFKDLATATSNLFGTKS